MKPLNEMTLLERLQVPGQFLIREYNSLNVQSQKVRTNRLGEEVVVLTGIGQRANAKNGNGRVYHKPILEREVNRYIDQFVKKRNAVGSLDHSSDPEVLLKEGSHIITNAWWSGNDLMVEMEILKDTPNGKIAQAYLNQDVLLGTSTRGVGSISEGNDGSFVNDDYQLICWDLVQNPSTQGAYMLREGIFVKTDEKIQLTNESVKFTSNSLNKANDLIKDILKLKV